MRFGLVSRRRAGRGDFCPNPIAELANHGVLILRLASLLETALLRKSLLAHQSSKLLKWQQALVEPFDGNLLEKLLAMPDDEDLSMGINTEINILSDPVEIYIVASFGNAHRAILTNFAHKMLSMNRNEPDVRVNRRGKLW